MPEDTLEDLPAATEDPGQSPDASADWADIGLSDEMLAALAERGYTHPTQVQVQAVPLALTGKDQLVRSKTGSGKTAAFLIPTIERIPNGYGKVGAIVLCPTRELAVQIATEAEELVKGSDLRVTRVYGGVAIGPQADDLAAGYEIVVGTPGRVQDHIRRGNLKLGDALVGILDEADEMLSMGFFQEVVDILNELPKSAQILLFSATVEEKLKQLIGKFLKDPDEIYLSVDNAQASNTIHHVLYETTMDYPKPRQLLHVLEVEDPESAIIFCNTRSDTDLVARFLNRQGLVAEPISSDLTQKARERVMAKIKAGEIDFLVATDIAARGIDITDLTHVFNYSLPEDPAVYLHRTGRTGRIGKKGTAISFMGGKELATRKALIGKYKIRFEERALPSREEAEDRWTERHIDEMKAAVDGGLAFEGFLGMARSVRERGEAADALIAIALRGFFRWHRMEKSRQRAEDQGEDYEAMQELMAQRSRKSSSGGGGGGGRGRGGPRREGGGGGGRRRRS
jgi:ATP-dependent RNA helicase DeaD